MKPDVLHQAVGVDQLAGLFQTTSMLAISVALEHSPILKLFRIAMLVNGVVAKVISVNDHMGFTTITGIGWRSGSAPALFSVAGSRCAMAIRQPATTDSSRVARRMVLDDLPRAASHFRQAGALLETLVHKPGEFEVNPADRRSSPFSSVRIRSRQPPL